MPGSNGDGRGGRVVVRAVVGVKRATAAGPEHVPK